MTRGPAGADVATVHGVVRVPAHEVATVLDQNGAGDMFASGSSMVWRSGPTRWRRRRWVRCAPER